MSPDPPPHMGVWVWEQDYLFESHHSLMCLVGRGVCVETTHFSLKRPLPIRMRVRKVIGKGRRGWKLIAVVGCLLCDLHSIPTYYSIWSKDHRSTNRRWLKPMLLCWDQWQHPDVKNTWLLWSARYKHTLLLSLIWTTRLCIPYSVVLYYNNVMYSWTLKVC